jgi:hypothetical protein
MMVGKGETAPFWMDRWLDGKAIREIAEAFRANPKTRSKALYGEEGAVGAPMDCRYPGRA